MTALQISVCLLWLVVLANAIYDVWHSIKIAREKREAHQERESLQRKNAELEDRIRKLEGE